MDLRIQIPFETPKLRRLIRPLRAKLTTLNKTTSAHPSVLSHSSYSYCNTGSSKISNAASFGTGVGFGGLGVGAFGGYSKKPKITYKKKRGSFNRNDREFQSSSNELSEVQSASVSSTSTNIILNSQTSSESNRNPTSSQSPIRPTSVKTAPIPLPSTILSTPLRTHALSIRECYRELIQRLWFDGLLINSFTDYELYQNPSLEPAKFVRKKRVPSLIELSAMEVGKLIARMEKEEKDDDEDRSRGIAGSGELDVIEQIYEDIFSQWRRFVMLGHVTELCVQEIAIDSILLSLIEICIEHQAVCQAQSLLLHLISLNPSPLLLHQAYNLSIHAVQSHFFLDRVTEHLTCEQVTSTKDRYFFYQFLSVLNSHRAVVIGSKALTLLLEELIKVEEEHETENETQGKGKLDEIEYPIRTEQHLAGLIEIIVTRSLDIDSVLPTSTSVSAQNIESSDKIDGMILRTIELLIKSKYLFQQYPVTVFPLLLRGLQILYLHSKTYTSLSYSNPHLTGKLTNLTLAELASLIAKLDPNISISLLFTTFATSKNIFNLSKLLAEVGLIYHAVSITDELLSEHETFEPVRGSSRVRSFFAEDDEDDNDYESTSRTRRNRGRRRLGSARNKTDEKGTERIKMRNGVTIRMLEEFRDYCEAEIDLYEEAGVNDDSDAAKGYWKYEPILDIYVEATPPKVEKIWMIKSDIPSPCLSAGISDALVSSCSPTSTPHANRQYSAGRSDKQSQFSYGSINEFKYIESPLVIRQKDVQIQDQTDISWNWGVGDQQDSVHRADFKENNSSDQALRPSYPSCRSLSSSNSVSEFLPSPSPLINSRGHRDRWAACQGSSSSLLSGGRPSHHSLFEDDNNHQQTPLQRPRSQPKFDETGVFKVPTMPSFSKRSVDRPQTTNVDDQLGFFTPGRYPSFTLKDNKTETEELKTMNGLLSELHSPDYTKAGQKNQNRKGRAGISSKPHSAEHTASIPPSPYPRATTDSCIHGSIVPKKNTDNEDSTLTAKSKGNGCTRKRKRIIESDSESDFSIDNKENERSYRRKPVLQTRSQPARTGKGKTCTKEDEECSTKAQKDSIRGRERRRSKRLRSTGDTRRSTNLPPPKSEVKAIDHSVFSESDSHIDSDSDDAKLEMSTDTQIDELTTLMQDSVESVSPYHSITRASNYDDPSSADDDVDCEREDSETSGIEATDDDDDSNDSSSLLASMSKSNSNSDFESDDGHSSKPFNKHCRNARSNETYISSRSKKRKKSIKKYMNEEVDCEEEKVVTLNYGSLQIKIGKPLPKTTVPDELWG